MAQRPEQIRMIHEAQSEPAAWRVFVKEWISDGWFATQEEADAYAVKYEGRLRPGDLTIDSDVLGGFMVSTRRWNVDSEWKHKAATTRRVRMLHKGGRSLEDVQIAARASQEERALLNYGTVSLG